MRRIPLLRTYTVFNIDQCEGIEVDTIPVVASAEAIIRDYESPPRLEYGGSRASYVPSQDTIRMPHRGSFDSSAGYYSTLYHELVHSTGHSSRLGRVLDTQYASDAYSNEELIAEMGAAYLSAASDTELVAKSLDNTSAYIQHWLSKLHADRRLIIHVSSRAQKAVDWIRTRRPNVSEGQ